MHMNENCNPTYGKVDDILDLLTKSKSLHVLMELDRAGRVASRSGQFLRRESLFFGNGRQGAALSSNLLTEMVENRRFG